MIYQSSIRGKKMANSRPVSTCAKVHALLTSPKAKIVSAATSVSALVYGVIWGEAFTNSSPRVGERLYSNGGLSLCRNLMSYDKCNPIIDSGIVFRDAAHVVKTFAPITLFAAGALNAWGAFDCGRNLEANAVAPGTEYTSPAPK
jgi:hypothetical protein